MRVVVALGGNAVLRRGEPLTAETQRRNLERAADALAEIVRAGHALVVTHGNGPQVGLLALQAAAYDPTTTEPLDVLGAESEGMIGYLIEQALAPRLPDGARIATLLTQVEVDPADPAFRMPDKPIGPVYDRTKAEQLAAARGWAIARDGDGFRRVVASPRPRQVLEIGVIELLVDAGVVVICAGGGGIPVVRDAHGALVGVEAVIDKDRASALLASALGAAALVLLTDVPAVYTGWRTSRQKAITRAAPDALRSLAFAPGSMAPKVEAACDFVDAGGGIAGIGRLEDALAVLEGRAGTIISRAATGSAFDLEGSP
jgi:carbamate kinase